MNPLRRLFSENGISASRARTRTQDARRRARLRPWGEALETRRVLSTFKVNTLLDTDAVNLHSGKDASGRISLRSAIMAADALGGANTIKLPSGTIKLTIPGANEDAGATGDLDIKGNLTILGKGSSSSIVDGNSLDRVFEVLSGKVTISNLTIQHGSNAVGGGLFNSNGNLTLTSVVVQNNLAVGADGADGRPGFGISPNVVAGTPIVNNGGNGQDGSGGAGGGIFNAGSMTLTHCTIDSNAAVGGSGGQGLDGASAFGLNGTPSNDHTVANGQDAVGGNGGNGGAGGSAIGGGIANSTGARLTISDTLISANRVSGGEGGAGGAGGIGQGGKGADALDSAPETASVGFSGAGTGGAGGASGAGGVAEGGGLFNDGVVSLVTKANTFSGNQAFGGLGGSGGAGGAGIGNLGGNDLRKGGEGGGGNFGAGGKSGAGAQGGAGLGGGMFQGNTATVTSAVAVSFSENLAVGGFGGNGGNGGFGQAGDGGNGGAGAIGGIGGFGSIGSVGGVGGEGAGGGFFNLSGAQATFKGPSSSAAQTLATFTGNLARGGVGGQGGNGGSGQGGFGGNGGINGLGQGGLGSEGVGASGADGGNGGIGQGGGFSNAGNMSFTSITLNMTNNTATGANGANGGGGGFGAGGKAGTGTVGATGGAGNGGNGGRAGGGGGSGGGGGFNDHNGILVIAPRQGAKRGSRQSKAVGSITSNVSSGGQSGLRGSAGSASGGLGASGGQNGTATAGQPGVINITPGPGLGGGLDLSIAGNVTLSNTNVTGNHASTGDNDVSGTFHS